MTNYAGQGINFPQGITAGVDGALWFCNGGNNSIGRITTAGVATSYTDPRINFPQGITTGPHGALWFIDEDNTIGVSALWDLSRRSSARTADIPQTSERNERRHERREYR